MSICEIDSALRGKRFALQDEKELQGQMAEALKIADSKLRVSVCA